jgi:hypothetical protein
MIARHFFNVVAADLGLAVSTVAATRTCKELILSLLQVH